jgi:CheY-like chemotaxis protein
MILPENVSVLIVEDNRAQARLIEIFLREIGCTNPITIMKRGDEAWQFLMSAEVEPLAHLLVFLDLNLPGIHGQEILKGMRERAKTIAIPVIIVTSSADQEEEARCRKLGANAYIQKPPSTEVLRATILGLGPCFC